MRYLNILLVLVIVGVSAMSFIPADGVAPGISHNHSDTESTATACHCEFHHNMDIGHTYMVSCDWSDKLSVKQTGNIRSMSAGSCITNTSGIVYSISPSSEQKPDNITASPELPPPKHLS